MKHLLTAFLLGNVIWSTVWACGSGPKPVHYGVFQPAKTLKPAASSTNSVVVVTTHASGR
jgi:hypothetical protein